jgi:C4-dicarboxylate-specific signal transduction histidine kinase
MAQGRDSGSFQTNLPATGEPILVAFRRLAEYPSLYAVTAMPRALIIRQWWQDIWHVLAFGLPAMLALGGLAWRAAQQQASLLAAKAELETRVAERTAQLADEGQRLALILEATQLGSW